MAKIICYAISNKEGDQYQNLMNAIKKHEGCCQIAESCWVITTPESSKQIRDNLVQFLDTNDRLFVATLEKGTGAWANIMESSEILQNILKG